MKKQSPGYSCDIQLFTYTLTNGYEEVGVIKNCIRLTDSEISLAHAAIIGARINLVMDTYLRSGTPKIGTKIPADFINVKFDPRDIKIHASPKPLPSWKGLHRFRYSNLYR